MAAPAPLSIATSEDEWRNAESISHPTLTDAKNLVKFFDGGRWASNRSAPGNERARNYVCALHEGCKAQLRAVQVGAVFRIQYRGAHGTVLAVKKRKNSALTVKEAAVADVGVLTGAPPGASRSASVTTAQAADKAAGLSIWDKKKAQGGHEGALPPSYTFRLASPLYAHMYEHVW